MRLTAVIASLCFAVTVATLTGCSGSSYDARLASLAKHLRGKQIGDSTDHWIEKYSTLANEWQRTGVIFGYSDDYEACEDFIRGLVAQYPTNRYRCVPAN